MKEKIFCKCCNTQTNLVIDSFSRFHLKKIHNMSLKEYYDIYIKGENEGICLECGKETKFVSYKDGYNEFCSRECARKSKIVHNRIKEATNNIDYDKVRKKYNDTCMERYNVDSYNKTKDFKVKYTNTCMERYGVLHNFLLDDCKLKRESSLNSDECKSKRKEWWSVEENKENFFNNLKDTLLEKYNVDHVSKIKGVKEKIRETRISKGHWFNYDNLEEKELYYKKVRDLTYTKDNMNMLFENWDGKCYYTHNYIDLKEKEDFSKMFSIDHKISIYHGFTNNISPETIGHINNLCICIRSVNSSKGQLTESEYYERENKKKI